MSMSKKLHQRSWKQLTPYQREKRQKSLEVLKKMRTKGYSITKASREVGIKPKTVLKHTNAVKKVGTWWKAKRYDKIERTMRIASNGREYFVDTRDSRNASKLGKYQNALKIFYNTGDESVLIPFKNKRIRDSKGKWHTLETNPDKLWDIADVREDEEFYTVYKEEVIL